MLILFFFFFHSKELNGDRFCGYFSTNILVHLGIIQYSCISVSPRFCIVLRFLVELGIPMFL